MVYELAIFPGAYAPALSEVLPVIERTGLIVSDIEILRLQLRLHAGASGASASVKIARRWPVSTTSASAGCGNSIWRAPKSASATRARWCFRPRW